jgi:two-component system sensor histidine kinase/response regulator
VKPPEGKPDKDEAVARLEIYQTRLDNVRKRQEYDQLFDHAPADVGLHEIDMDKKVTRVNPSELKILGYRADQVLGKQASTFAVMKDASVRAVEKKLAGGGLKPFVRTFLCADGSAITLVLVERYLKDARGQIIGIRTAVMPIGS